MIRLEIIRKNRGQEPATIKEALKVAGITRHELTKQIKNGHATEMSIADLNIMLPAGWDYNLIATKGLGDGMVKNGKMAKTSKEYISAESFI